MKKAAVLGLAAVLLVSGLAFAAPRRERARAFGRLSQELDLSLEQRERIRSILRDGRDGDLGDAFRAARVARRRVGQVVHDPAAGADEVRKAVREAEKAAEALAVERHETFLEVFSVLTPEQKEKAKRLLEIRRSPRVE